MLFLIFIPDILSAPEVEATFWIKVTLFTTDISANSIFNPPPLFNLKKGKKYIVFS